MSTIAVIDDNSTIQSIIESSSYTGSNLLVKSYRTSNEFISALPGLNPDLIMLNINMDQKQGFRVFNEIKKKHAQVGIIFITEKTISQNKLLGMDLGADEIIAKPFQKEEIISRIKTVLRRKAVPKIEKNTTHTIYQFKELSFNTEAKTLFIGSKNIKITRTEYLILKLLTSTPKRVYSREEILDNVWKDSIVSERTIDVHIRRLRKKMGSYKDLLKTHSGFGYSILETE